MDTRNHTKTKLGYCIFVFVALYHMFSHVHVQVDGRSISSVRNMELAKHEGAIKTIQSEDGDVIDCVDIYKQPAFNHPLLKNHTVQMKPSSYPRGMETEQFESELLQGWHKNGQCPEGTIPIVRAQIHNSTRTMAFVPRRKNLDQVASEAVRNHEYAQVSAVNGNYFGASAMLNVWNPPTFDNEFSLAQIWLLSGPQDELNSMEAGWIVSQVDKRTKLFIYWTSDDYQSTGCYNLDCPGFVQTDKKFGLGGNLEPVSTYGGKQYEMSITIHKDKQSGNWWLRIQNVDLGYWPGSIFTGLSDRADFITWGGEIVNSELEGRHTSTQMGSGHFPSEDFGKASFFRNLGYIDDSGAVRDPENLVPYASNPSCYDLHIPTKNDFGTHFYFGGPGYSDKCQ
ncbi:PREDICTED: uncharacterized protein LOC18596072 [Theobroma cacao]|uniref:Uncharacterized protein LOC18596072 n=1 Tax=Theobroma cacao TaxID=3641 RepID=A0AB32WNK1_THECC|nr:PREDICTED: uncharacterized protein LOC18596072 [Theobroma cacao]